jgi:hypothetical protein
MKLMCRLQECTTGRRVLVLLAITISLYMTILFYTIPSVTARAPEMRLFDMSPGGYSQTDAESLLAAIGPEGRNTYLKLQLPVDFVYPGFFAVTCTMTLVWLFRQRFGSGSKVFLLAPVPAAAGFFDYMENFGILLMLRSYPDLSPWLVRIASNFSILKSALTVAFYILLFYGLIVLFVKRKPPDS